jgi:hypothetical protein
MSKTLLQPSGLNAASIGAVTAGVPHLAPEQMAEAIVAIKVIGGGTVYKCTAPFHFKMLCSAYQSATLDTQWELPCRGGIKLN